jgi:hypothetical protein
MRMPRRFAGSLLVALAWVAGGARADDESEARLRRIDAWIELALVGDEADRASAVEALAREGAPAVERLVERLRALAPPSQTMTAPPQTAPAPQAQTAPNEPLPAGPPDGQQKSKESDASPVASFTVTGAYVEVSSLRRPALPSLGTEAGVPFAQGVDRDSAAAFDRVNAAAGAEPVPFEVRSVDGRAVVERQRATTYRRDAERTPEGWKAATGEIREGWRVEIGVERTKAGERVTLVARSARIARPMRTDVVLAEGAPAVEIDVPEWSVVSTEMSVTPGTEGVAVMLPGFGAAGEMVTMRFVIRRE